MKVLLAIPKLVNFDSVGYDILEQYQCLKEVGIDAFLYAENFTPTFSPLITKNASHLLKDKDTILIYHHSTYWERGNKLLKDTKGKNVIRYHNITPEHFFQVYSFKYFRSCFLGRRQTRELAIRKSDLALSNSLFSAKDFADFGLAQDKIRVFPPFHNIHRFADVDADIRTLNRLSDGKINVFFVGRVAPNKGHKNIIYSAYYYHLLFGNNIRFIIAGGLDPSLNSYYIQLRSLISRLEVDRIVEFVGRISLPELKAYYLSSDVFLLLSEHEGFCVPILEAQHSKLPLIAYGSSAIKETMGENQLVYDHLDYSFVASSIYTLSKDTQVKTYLTQEGYKNFLKYERSELKRKFISFLAELQ